MEAGSNDKHPNDIVISGVSCRLPESDSVEEFWQHLISGDNMVTEDDRRWKPGMFGLPKRNGKLKDLSRFDAEFFRTNRLQAHAMDPQLRILLEVTYEAIVDAGLDPNELRGSPTGVYVGVMFLEALEASGNLHSRDRIGYGLSGGNGCMMSNYLSFCFDFRGPSLTVNTACASSLNALDLARQDLRSGRCRYAVVAGSNIMLKPATPVHLNRLRMICPDASCKTFDTAANGYARSEGIVAVMLSERRNARRAYLQVLNCRSAFDGYKPEGITYPNGAAQSELIQLTFAEAGVNPADVFYVEAHGTGTQAGDYEECKSLDETICSCRVRNVQCPSEKAQDPAPLLVGSVKSNMGHSESAAGLASIVKVILAFRHGEIPPNLHFSTPNPKITSIIEGRLSVVTKATPIPPSAIVSLNSFGFGGAISHVIVRGERNPISTDQKLTENITLAFPVASRTPEGLAKLIDFVLAHRDEKEVLALLQPVMSSPHINRGYLLWKTGCNSEFEPRKKTIAADTGSSPSARSRKRPVWFVFCGMGSQWSGMGQDLLQYPVFRRTVERCYAALPSDVKNIIATGGLDESCSVLDETTAICVVSLALFEMLRVAGVVPDGLIGHSLGEVSASCADGCLTLEQTVRLIFWRAKCISEANIPPGAMAATGLTWEEAGKRCPEGVWPACNNIQGVIKNVTVAGEEKAVEDFVAQLKGEGTFAKVVKSAGLAFHCPHMQPLLNDKALETLKKIIPEPKYQSPKWIVTSVPPDRAASEPVLCSAEFHLKSTVSQVFFHEAIKKIPRDAVVIEIGPHAILQAILKKGLSPEATLLPLQNLKEGDQAVVFMRALGECYNAGVNVDPLALLEPMEFPIGAQTPGIGHLVSWNHSDEWLVPKPEDFSIQSRGGTLFATADSKVSPDEEYEIDGSPAVPAARYLLLAWKTLAEFYGEPHSKVPVAFSDITFHESLWNHQKDPDAPMEVNTLVSPISGHFEITEGQNLLVTGNLRRQVDGISLTPELSSSTKALPTDPPSSLHGITRLTQQDIYKELSLKGYCFGQQFQTLAQASLNISKCQTQPGMASWFHALDAPFQAALLSGSGFSRPASIESVLIDPLLLDKPEEAGTHQLKLRCNPQAGEYTAHCVSVKGLQLLPRERKPHDLRPQIEKYAFQPYLATAPIAENVVSDQLRYMIDVVIENTGKKEVSLLQVVSGDADWSLTSLVSETVKSRSMRRVSHNVVLAGEAASKPEGLTLSGDISHVESLGSTTPADVRHNMVVADTVNLKSMLTTGTTRLLKTVLPGGFLLLKKTLPTEGTAESAQDGSHARLEERLSRELNDLNFCHVATRLYQHEKTNSKGALLLYRQLDRPEIPDSEVAFVHIEAAARQFAWIPELQNLLSRSRDGPTMKRIYCISEVDSATPSGLVGMINCLRLEPNGDRLRCLYLIDEKWESFRSGAAWREVRRMDLVMTVVKGGEIGSFRHSPHKTTIAETEPTPVPELPPTPSLSTNSPQPTPTRSQFVCDPDKSYVITGGLGGFGLELATWLVERGARRLCLTGRSGVKSGYQARKLGTLLSRGAKVEVTKLDVSDANQAETLLKSIARNLGGIFHLAGVLRDGLFENQTAESFKAAVGPKLTGAANLDKAMRTQSVDASTLFVVFSSVASGFGNVGQSNYAFANSAMDRLCEQRRGRGLHGLAIQWGAIGGVGMLQGKTGKVESVAGTRLQPISSCLDTLDVLLTSSTSAVVSCYVPAEISPRGTPSSSKQTRPAEDGFKTALCQIIGVRNPDEVRPDATLGELGMDSVMSFEVTQLVEKECGVSLSREELLSTKVGTLIEKAMGATQKSSVGDASGSDTSDTASFKGSLCSILGLPDPDKLDDEATLSQLGLDSLMSFEIRQLLEEEHDTTLTKDELPAMAVKTLLQRISRKSAAVPGSTDVGISTDGGSDQSAVCSASSSVTGLGSPPKVTPTAEE